jgi:hypothetical protein
VADLLAALLAELNQGRSRQPDGTAVLQGAAQDRFPLPGETSVLQVPARQAAPTRRWLWAAAALVLLVAGLGLGEAIGVTAVRGTVIRLFSPEGTLVVEVDDPDVSVTVDGGDVVITGAGAKEIRLKPGQYHIEASKDGKVVRQELVTVTRNGRQVVRISKEPLEYASTVPAVNAWEKLVAALPADKQVEAVTRRLQELNPGFNGQVTPIIEDGVVTGLAFISDNVADISPVRALAGLKALNCRGDNAPDSKSKVSNLAPLRGMKLTRLVLDRTGVADLSDLRGMPLKELMVNRTWVADLSPLQGMPLKVLRFEGTPVADLTPLKGMQLEVLYMPHTRVADLSPLCGMPLAELHCGSTNVTDLKPLKGMPLKRLYIYDTRVADLAPLRGMALEELQMGGTAVTDLAPLKGMPLTDFVMDNFRAERDAAVLRSLTTLQKINFKPAADFWKEVDGK